MSPREAGAGRYLQEIARQLLAHEAVANGHSETNSSASRVLEALRQPLSTLVGVQGCRVLLVRALKLAKARAPGVSVEVHPDSSITGLNDISGKEGSGPGIAIVAELLGLLATFIGTDLMQRILLTVWPDLTFPDTEISGELET